MSKNIIYKTYKIKNKKPEKSCDVMATVSVEDGASGNFTQKFKYDYQKDEFISEMGDEYGERVDYKWGMYQIVSWRYINK